MAGLKMPKIISPVDAEENNEANGETASDGTEEN